MEVGHAVKQMSALAQPSRLQVFRLLARFSGDEGGVCAGQIAHELDVPPATLSFHLKELTNSGLLSQRRDGRSMIYSLHIDAVRALIAYLMEDCCNGRPELCQPDYSVAECSGKCSASD